MEFAPNEAYQPPSRCTIVIFDTRVPGISDRLLRERDAWQESADIEALDEDHYVLVIEPGGAWRLTG